MPLKKALLLKMLCPINPDKMQQSRGFLSTFGSAPVSSLNTAFLIMSPGEGHWPNSSLINRVNDHHQNQQHKKNSNPGKIGMCEVNVAQKSVSRRWWRLWKTNVQYDNNVVVRPHVYCLVSGGKNADQYDDEDDEEDSQTDGDPNLLLHWNKQNFHLAHKLILIFAKTGT